MLYKILNIETLFIVICQIFKMLKRFSNKALYHKSSIALLPTTMPNRHLNWKMNVLFQIFNPVKIMHGITSNVHVLEIRQPSLQRQTMKSKPLPKGEISKKGVEEVAAIQVMLGSLIWVRLNGGSWWPAQVF